MLHCFTLETRVMFLAAASNELFKSVTYLFDNFHCHHVHNYAYECMRARARVRGRDQLTLQIRFVAEK